MPKIHHKYIYRSEWYPYHNVEADFAYAVGHSNGFTNKSQNWLQVIASVSNQEAWCKRPDCLRNNVDAVHQPLWQGDALSLWVH